MNLPLECKVALKLELKQIYDKLYYPTSPHPPKKRSQKLIMQPFVVDGSILHTVFRKRRAEEASISVVKVLKLYQYVLWYCDNFCAVKLKR